MATDLVDLIALECAATRWDDVAEGLRVAAARWRAHTGPPGSIAFSARAAAALDDHAAVASAAAARLRDYCAAVRAVDTAAADAITRAAR